MKYLNAASYLCMVIINILATIGKLNGLTTKDISMLYDNVLVPASWTFSIWSLIYVTLAVFIIASFVKPKGKSSMISKEINIWFFISCMFNTMWVLFWQYKKLVASFAVMIALLISLYIIFIKMQTTKDTLNDTKRVWKTSIGKIGFSIYFGWIAFATFGNIMSVLVFLELDGFSLIARILAFIFIVFLSVIIAIITINTRNYAFAASGLIAILGVLYRQVIESEFNSKYPLVILAAILGLLTIGAGIGLGIFKEEEGVKNGLQKS